MAPWGDQTNITSHYCECGRKMKLAASSDDMDHYYCYHGKDFVGTTMPWYSESAQTYPDKKEELTQSQKSKLWLFNKRQEEIKRGWKRDQYAKVHGQIRI